MDREFILKASQSYYIDKNLKDNVISKILKDYCCIEHNKDEDNIDIFIQIILSHFNIFHTMFEYALNYYENKFNVIKLIINNKIIKIY